MKICYSLCALLFLPLASFPSAAAKAIPAVALTEVNSSTPLSHAVCAAIDNLCKTDARATLWRDKKEPAIVWAITSEPALLRITHAQNTYHVSATWSFKDYPFHDNEVAENDNHLARQPAEVYPALYPLSATKQAVALLDKWSVGYAGGGMEQHYADFLMLNDDGTWAPVLRDIDFFATEVIKVCLAEASKNPEHCHDEFWRILQIRITDTGEEAYSWELIHTDRTWPAHEDKSRIRKDVVRQERVYPFRTGHLLLRNRDDTR